MPRVSANGIDLYYEEFGAGAPILGIHGTPSSAVLWEEAARELAQIGRCIIYDRRGFARSRPPEPFDSLDLDQHLDDAVALIDAVAAGPVFAIGRSTGGLIALALAHHHPEKVRALVLLEPALFTADPEAEAWAIDLRRQVLTRAADDLAVASESVIGLALGVEVWNSFSPQLRDLLAAASPAVLAEMRGRGLDLSDDPLRLEIGDLAQIEHEILLVSSQDSPAALRQINDRLALALPNPEVALVPGGHIIHPAHPAVLRFLARVIEAS
jgi:pimeloyl-ACP methyl ester carboxylesterase